MDEKRRILVAEDEPAAAAMVGLLLKREGFEVIHAANGREAVAIAREHRPAIILMDVNMPDMDGIAACRGLKQDPETRDIPLVFLTANDEPSDIVLGLSAGGDDYVTKPPINAVLLARIRAQLRIRDLHHQNVAYLDALYAARRDADVGLLLGGIAHNYNNLLAPLMSTASSMQTAVEMKDYEEIGEMAGEVRVAAQRLKEFNARVGHVRRRCEPSAHVALGQCLDPVLDLFSCALPSRIVFARNFDPEVRGLPVPNTGLDDALLALLVNAREAIERSGRGGNIELSAERIPTDAGAHFRLVVADDGPGIPPPDLERVFIPFFSTKNTVGAGLGLPLARRTATQMGGTLRLEPRSPSGVRAVLDLPLPKEVP